VPDRLLRGLDLGVDRGVEREMDNAKAAVPAGIITTVRTIAANRLQAAQFRPPK
jgi:hypothetical protein